MKKPFSKLFDLIDKSDKTYASDELVTIQLENIVPNRYQPRTVFDRSRIEELADSIQVHGLLQPITVRPIEEEMYEIIAGERRFRALKLLKYDVTDVLIKYLTDEETAAIALIENIQRENLSVVEEAKAYENLLKMKNITQKDLALKLGKSQSFIANKLRLLKLSDDVLQALNNQEITERHARSLLGLNDDSQQSFLKEILSEQLTVKETEARVRRSKSKTETMDFHKDVPYMLNNVEKEVLKLKDRGLSIQMDQNERNDHFEVIIKVYK